MARTRAKGGGQAGGRGGGHARPQPKTPGVGKKGKEKVRSMGTTRKDEEPETVFSSGEDSDGDLVEIHLEGFPVDIRMHVWRANPSTFRAAVELNGILIEEK
ncbi:hypothetical protein L1987_08508 [Smallanthus sonchifolius]|uniref:Uncharacterized protein n=1 Tax=Smallanthus sonchifolius TaxID=185202 RepID=A0ACB9JLC9_9ASTR|nr:hypothetical protein L1987_08508 [Smallanthus sonchifolius]